MSELLQNEILQATNLGRRLEALVVERGEFKINNGGRDYLFIGCWSLLFEHYKGILCLLRHNYYAPAFALLRPVVDALVRCHIALIGTDEEERRIAEPLAAQDHQDSRRVSQRRGGAEVVVSGLAAGGEEVDDADSPLARSSEPFHDSVA